MSEVEAREGEKIRRFSNPSKKRLHLIRISVFKLKRVNNLVLVTEMQSCLKKWFTVNDLFVRMQKDIKVTFSWNEE